MVSEVSMLAAFIAGVVSFLSPCVLPLIPGYISFISGFSLEELRVQEDRGKLLRVVSLNTLFFILGFSLVFISLGASATFVGKLVLSHLSMLKKIAGAVVVIFGLHVLGVFRIAALYKEKRLQADVKPKGILGSFFIGLAFALGWTPCIGPILAAILAYAATQETISKGILLLTIYSLGLGIPFFFAGLGINAFLGFSSRVRRYFKTIELVSGALLIIFGLLIFTDNLTWLAQYFSFLNRFAL